MKSIFLISLMLTFTLACKPIKDNLTDYRGKQLIIANGGGFTGELVEYILLDNGYIYRHNSLTNTKKFHKRIGIGMANQIFDNYEVLKIGQLDLNEPGNMYFYIRLTEDEIAHEVKWNTNSEGEKVDKAKLFYKTVLQRIR